MSSHRSRLCCVFKKLPLSLLITGALVGSGTSSAFSQSVTSGADRTFPQVCVEPCEVLHEKVAVDSAGNAIAIWREQELANGRTAGDGPQRLFTSRFNATTGAWSAPRVMPKTVFNNLILNPDVGMAANGDALVTWTEFEDATGAYDVRYARYVASHGTWTTTMRVERSFTYLGKNRLLVARNGNAFLQQRAESIRLPCTGLSPGHYYDAATATWKRLANDTQPRCYENGAIDEFGNVVLPFRLYRNDGQSLHAVRFSVSSKLVSSPIALDNVSYTNGSASGFVGVTSSKDRYNNDMVLWQRLSVNTDSTITRTIRSIRYQSGSSRWVFKPITRLNNGQISSATLVADRSANVSAIWTQYVGAYSEVVFARYSSSTGNWSLPRTISPGNFLVRDATVDVDLAGNLIAAWSQRTDTGAGSSGGKIFRAKAARYAAKSNTWGTPITVQDANVNSYRPVIDVDDRGRAVMIWNEDKSATTFDDDKRLRADHVIPQ